MKGKLKMLLRSTSAAAATLLLYSPLFAAFQNMPNSVKAEAMGGAFTALSSFSTALSWNASVAGSHTLQAKAVDISNAVYASLPVTISVAASNLVSLMVTSPSLGDGMRVLEGNKENGRALVVGFRSQSSQTLVFDEQVQSACIVSLRGHVLRSQTKQGSPILMTLQNSGDSAIGMESGLWLIQMEDGQNHPTVKPLLIVK